MVCPSPALRARLFLTTKQTTKGYYKGTGTGSVGAHTGHGNYVIDYRKVRTFVVPDLSNCKLTPFVTAEMRPRSRREDGMKLDPPRVDGLRMLQTYKTLYPAEWEEMVEAQEQDRKATEEEQKQVAKQKNKESSKRKHKQPLM